MYIYMYIYICIFIYLSDLPYCTRELCKEFNGYSGYFNESLKYLLN